MPKRARIQSDAEDDTASDSVQVSSDASYREPSKPRNKKTRQTRNGGPGTSKRASATTPTRVQHDVGTHSGPCDTHPTSWHVVAAGVTIDAIRASLLRWYDKVHDVRGMPWRKRFDASLSEAERGQRAYEVWVSEVMLQQTQVATVIPYYNKWMTRFSTLRELAASDIDTVNGLWKGLGYYSRAARLLSGAQIAVRELHGHLPDNAKEMQSKIPGIGRYSAGAICSIAYNQCVPVLDGNVIRLLTRFLALYAPPKAKQAQDILWAGAEAFVERSQHPGDINQALIELGSTVCKVRDPACGNCPLQSWCHAYQRTQSDSNPSSEEADIEELCSLCEPLPVDDSDAGLVTIYPMKVERKRAREELDSVNVIEWRTVDERQRFFLLVRRPEGGLLAGLDEFPTVSNISATAAKVAEIPNSLLEDLLVDAPCRHQNSTRRDLCEQENGECEDGGEDQRTRIVHVKPAGEVVHVFSHIRKTYRVQWVLLMGGAKGSEPPELRPSLGSGSSAKRKGSETKVSRKRKAEKQCLEASEAEVETRSVTPVSARWVPMDQVEHANIGTGVVKVWKQVQKLWRGPSSSKGK